MYSGAFMKGKGGFEMDLKLNYTELIKKLIVVIIAGLLNAIGMNLFLTPAKCMRAALLDCLNYYHKY